MGKSISSRDRTTIWHPYTQHGLNPESIGIIRGKGSWVYDEQGRKYLDVLSSWWTCLHGHSHPYIAEKISKQLRTLEHVIFAGFTHKPAVELAERLLKKLPTRQQRVFFSDNGSTAVEVALKMSFQIAHLQGKPRPKVLAFRNAYHGDTLGAMSVSERGAFTQPFQDHLFQTIYIDPPVEGSQDRSVAQMKEALARFDGMISCFIFEPLVQGVAGMVVHDPNALDELIRICRAAGVLTIADEVFTGFGRTGKFFASDYLKQQPDIFCLSKGLTGGVMAMGVTTCTEKIFRAFVSEDRMKTFFHGHSFTANPVACSAALASLDLMERAGTKKNIRMIISSHGRFRKKLKGMRGIREVRGLGVVLAIELESSDQTSYFNQIRDKAISFFLSRGILLRPLGNVIYLVPPYCISRKELEFAYQCILDFIEVVRKDLA